MPLLSGTGWAFLAALALIIAGLVIDRPIAAPDTMTGIVTQVYVSPSRYSVNTVRCRVEVRNEFFLDGACAPAQIGAHVKVCKSVRRLSGMEAYAIC